LNRQVSKCSAVCRDEVFSSYLRLLPDKELESLVGSIGVSPSEDYQPTFADWVSTPPEWAARPDLWQAAAEQVGSYSDRQLVEAMEELKALMESE
jgi:hypothetical protein